MYIVRNFKIYYSDCNFINIASPYRYRSGSLSYDQISCISEEKYSSIWAEQAGKQQLPFKPRGIPFSVYDQYNPSILMTR